MFKRCNATFLIGAAMVLLMLSATACDGLPSALTRNLPISLTPATSTPTPTMTPLPTPQAAATPAAPPGNAPKRANAAQALQALLISSGLTGGVVASNDGNTLGLKFGKTSEQLQIASNAIVIVPGVSNATMSDIHVGDRVIADLAGGATNAPAVFLLDVPAGYTADNLMLGAVMPSKGGALNLRTPRGARSVTTSGSTAVVTISGDQPAVGSPGDLQPANAVLVIGQGSGSAFNAQVIVVLGKDARALLRKVNPKNAPSATPTPGA